MIAFPCRLPLCVGLTSVPAAAEQLPAVVEPGGGASAADAGEQLLERDRILPASADSITSEGAGGDVSESEAGEPVSDGDEDADQVTGDQSTADTGEIDVERLERIKQLAKVYEQMNASSVTAIISNMREDDAVAILSNMKPRSAAKVLAYLEPETAADLSLRLTE